MEIEIKMEELRNLRRDFLHKIQKSKNPKIQKEKKDLKKIEIDR